MVAVNNFWLNFFTWSCLLTAFTSACLGILAYLKKRDSFLNKIWFLLSLAVAMWSFGWAGIIASTAKISLFWARFNYFGATLIAPLFLHFILTFLNITRKKILFSAYIFGIAFLAIDFFTDLLVKGVMPKLFFRYYTVGGPLIALFSLYFCFYVAYALYLQFVMYKAHPALKRLQAKYILLASLFGFGGGVTGLPLAAGIDLVPFGQPLVLLYPIIITYAIIKYRAMDIQVVFSKALGGALLAIGAVFFHITVVGSLQARIGYNLANVISLAVIAYLFLVTPLRNKIQSLINSIVLKGKYDYQEILKDAGRAVITILDLDELLRYLIDVIKKSLRVNKIVLLLKTEGGVYIARCGYGISEEVLYGYAVRNGIVDWIKKSRDVFVKEEQQMAFSQNEFCGLYKDMSNIGTEVAVPLFYKDELEGILTLGQKANGEPYVQSDIDLLEALASHATVAIKNAQLYEEAIRDSLTHLYHHKYFESRLTEEMQRAKRYGHPLSLLMLDLDHFKDINDKYGHPTGDAILKKISDMLRQNLRGSDILCRYGGEEFAILLPETPDKGAHTASERLRMHIHDALFTAEKLRISIDKETFGNDKGKLINLSVSIGIGYFDGQDKELSPEKLVSRADRALYKAKQNGRNRTELWDT
jgi:diguanylate cyclase (GGDEF)-like protein